MRHDSVFPLHRILSEHFLKYSLIPILVIEVSLLILYFAINFYIYKQNESTLKKEALRDSYELLKYEANKIDRVLSKVTMLATIMQKEHERIFANAQDLIPKNPPTFGLASNGVYYKTTKQGASLYYSSKTPITQKEREKALFTEAMDPLLTNLVELNPNIVAAYFNSYDNMNRLYPFIDKVYEQYGEHLSMAEYNFYFLANQQHNPKREAVWTNAYLDPAGQGWMVSCVTPIYKGDFLEGVSGLDITIDKFVSNILDIHLAYDAKMFLIDEKGMILAMPSSIEKLLGLEELKEHTYRSVIKTHTTKPEHFNIFKNTSPFATHFKTMLLQKQSYAELTIGKQKYITLKHTIDQTKWKLMIVMEEQKIFTSIYQLKAFSDKIGYVAIIVMAIFYLLFFYLLFQKSKKVSREIVTPLEKLTKQTSCALDIHTKLQAIHSSVKEINVLSYNFSIMVNKLNRLTQTKSEFLANMSHEIRTPLNAIVGFIHILKEEPEREKARKYINTIDASCKSLLQIIEDILDFSKIESGKLAIDAIYFDPIDEFKLIVDLFSRQCSEKNISLHLRLDQNLPASIKLDPLRIKQIIANLISNAVKFTNAGNNIFVDIIYKKHTLSVMVKDEGKGIDAKKLHAIFESFTQEDNSTTRKYGGTGLGLSISYELVRLMGGELKVKSEVGKGSEFYFTIPVEIGGKIKKISTEPHHYWFNQEKLLVVEDNKINQDYIKIILDNVNLAYDFADDGKIAVRMFKQNTYRVVLMDENMPNMNGIEATKHILAYEKSNNLAHTPIIALTANALQGDKERFMSAGMNGYIAKPIEVEKLYQALLEYIPIKTKEASHTPTREVSTSSLPEFETLDTAYGLKLVLGNEKAYMTILKGLLAFKTLDFTKLNEEELHRSIHSLKGLCASAGALDLSELAKEIELSFHEDLLEVFVVKLQRVIEEIESKLIQEDKKEKLELSSEKRDALFEQLKEALASQRAKKCKPIIEEIERYQLSKEDAALFAAIKTLTQKFKFKKAMELFL